MHSSPKIRCGQRSGYDCDVLVSLDSRHCGDPDHVPGAEGGAARERARSERPRLTVDEEYDLFDESIDGDDLDPVTFDVSRVHLTKGALAAWPRKPWALKEEIRRALLRGGYWRTDDGGHLLEHRRHQMELSPDARRCIAYRPLAPVAMPESGDAVDELDADHGWDPEDVELTEGVLRTFGGRHRVDEDAAAEELFDLLDDALVRGRRSRRADGSHRLEVDGFFLFLTPDGLNVYDYESKHAERTPAQVRNGVPSRFGKGRQRPDRRRRREDAGDARNGPVAHDESVDPSPDSGPDDPGGPVGIGE